MSTQVMLDLAIANLRRSGQLPPPSPSLREQISELIERKRLRPKVRKIDGDVAAGKAESRMPGGELGFLLANRAFELLDASEFSVSSVLSVDRPETLRNFDKLQLILLMAYEEGLKARQHEGDNSHG